MVPPVSGRHERRHPAGPERLWAESWYFDFVAANGSMGGYVRLGLHPGLGAAWFWAGLVGVGRRLVTVRDHDIALPRGDSLEIRGGALWSMFNCETALDHWSVGLEAFAVAFDDPTEAYRGERGDRVGLGFDLEWEARDVAAGVTGVAGHYEQSCQVHGEVLVGDEQLMIDGTGQRYHGWGVEDWWLPSGGRASGTLSDGTAFAAWDGSGAPGAQVQVTSSGGLVVAGWVLLGDVMLLATPVAQSPTALDGPGGQQARLARALCSYRSDDGRPGTGWMECVERSSG